MKVTFNDDLLLLALEQMKVTNHIYILAIRVALAYGLEVFTTVSTPAKKKFIMETFPQLKGKHFILFFHVL